MSNTFDQVSILWEERIKQLMEIHQISREDAYNMLCQEMDESAKDSKHKVRVRTIIRKNESKQDNNQPSNE